MINARKLFALIAQLLFFHAGLSFASPLNDLETQLATHPADRSFLAIDAESGEVLFDLHSRRPLKPASTQKLLTTLAALRSLGPAYSFATDFYVHAENSARPPTLYIRGTGDPVLTIEDTWLLARLVRRRNTRLVERLAIDSSAFVEQRPRSGERAFQAGSAPLTFNYNSVGIEVCPNGEMLSASIDPPELKALLSVHTGPKGGEIEVQDQSSCRNNGCSMKFRVSGDPRRLDGECRMVYRSAVEPQYYFANVFRALLQSSGITVAHDAEYAQVPVGAKLLFTHHSKPLSEVLQLMNQYSNNVIAEQVLYALGADADGRFSRQRGLDTVATRLRDLGFREGEDFILRDGSGLSHDNRVSAAVLVAVLRDLLRDPGADIEFLSTLPVGGRSGTLKERFANAASVIRAKTGTLDGVSALAGQLVTPRKRKILFALLQNGVASKEEATHIEENVISTLERL